MKYMLAPYLCDGCYALHVDVPLTDADSKPFGRHATPMGEQLRVRGSQLPGVSNFFLDGRYEAHIFTGKLANRDDVAAAIHDLLVEIFGEATREEVSSHGDAKPVAVTAPVVDQHRLNSGQGCDDAMPSCGHFVNRNLGLLTAGFVVGFLITAVVGRLPRG